MGPGSEQEFREFVRQATPGLFRVAYALAGQQQAAEDLLQAALEKVVSRWRRIDDPVAYTRRVIYHEHIGRWRRWGRRELPVATPPEVVTSADPAAAVVLRQALYGALRRLPPQQRAVLVLRYLEDCSEAAAAELLGVSPKTVASQASRTGQFAIDQRDYFLTQNPGLAWHVSGLVTDGGAVLLQRHPEPGTLELATLDDTGITPGAIVMPDPLEHHFYAPSPVVALPGGQVLVAATLQLEPTGPLAPAGGGTSQLYVATDHYVADLTTGAVRPANVPALPDNGRPWIYADAAGLSAAAAHRAFTP